MIRELPSAKLTLLDLPPTNSRWHRIQEFALSFNGYQFTDRCGELANATASDFWRTGALPNSLTLDELRACLFYEQRRWRHFGEQPGPEEMNYIYRLIEAIREKVKSREKGKR
jgi:hypothetical protein